MSKPRRFASMCFNEKDSFRHVMEKISQAGKLGLPSGLALLLSKKEEVLGILTDGDIRKALIKGATLDSQVSPYIQRNPITIEEQELKENPISVVLRKLDTADRHPTRIEKIIVVDKKNRLVDIIDFHELVRLSDIRSQTVVVVGQGFVGLTLSLAMANIGFKVIGIEKNAQVVKELNAGRPHFYETGLEDILKHCISIGNYQCMTSLNDVHFDALIITVNAPFDNRRQRTNLEDFRNVCTELGKYLRKGHIIIQRTTVPVGTGRQCVKILEDTSGLKAGFDFCFAVAPERTVEGEAMKEVYSLPQIIGGFDEASAEAAARIFKPLASLTIIVESMEAAELGKLICNASRVVSFGFANQVALHSEQYNIDAHKLIKAVNEGYPRTPISMPSPGVGGICLKKDPYILLESDKTELATSITIEASKVNDQMPAYVIDKILAFKRKYYPGQKTKIFLLGFAFKGDPETSDTRDSSTWDVVKLLVEKCNNCDLYGFDPAIQKEKLSHPDVKFVDFEDGWKGAHAIVILNNHPFFSKMDIYGSISTLKRPCLIFDTWSMLPHEGLLREDGIILQTMGSLRMG